MPDTTFESELKTLFHAAVLHQARQPLFVLQNYLSAAQFLTKGLESSSAVVRLEKCHQQMQSAIERLGPTLENVATCADHTFEKPVSRPLARFVKEAFQIANFVFDRLKVPIVWMIDDAIEGQKMIPVVIAQFSLVQWIQNKVNSHNDDSYHEDHYIVAASAISGDVQFTITSQNNSQRCHVIQLGELAKAQ